ncbi:MAG: hypothetical protein BWK76_19250, partial [Desulfobulbaceae bacterium A2]
MTMFGGVLFFVYELKEAAVHVAPLRWLYFQLLFCRAQKAQRLGRVFDALDIALHLEREISAVPGARLPKKLQDFLRRHLASWPAGWRCLVASYRKAELARRHLANYLAFPLADRLRIRQPKKSPPPERQGDLLVLKPCLGPREKGVIFLNFDETVDKFFAMYDVERLAHEYRIVVEPSAWGYQQARMYLLRGLDTDVVVESQYLQDYKYIDQLGGSMRPIRLGAGDWVDPDLFASGRETEKKYDLAMVANWLKWKRHKLLFQAMRQLGPSIGKVALVGYPIEGRTSKEILALAKRYGVEEKIDLYEKISAPEVAEILRSSKAGIMLSKKEGANRGIYECWFSDIPIILTSSNIGVNRDHINQETGTLADDRELAEAIRTVCQQHAEFQPRAWALHNTGWKNASHRLNEFLKKLALQQHEEWT